MDSEQGKGWESEREKFYLKCLIEVLWATAFLKPDNQYGYSNNK